MAQHRDVIQTEYARVNVAKGKLENLCRELQKHSKAVAVSTNLIGFVKEAVTVLWLLCLCVFRRRASSDNVKMRREERRCLPSFRPPLMTSP